MYGFDTMLGSYYDNYVIEYISFERLNYQEDLFKPPSAGKIYSLTINRCVISN